MKKFMFFTAVTLFSTLSQAAVWDHKPGVQWDQSWEIKYSNWIAGSVGPNFFKNLGGPYARMKLDCADAHYAFLAYFARTNGLPFAAGGGATTNKTTRFDHISNADARFTKFVEFLAASYGTEALSHRDTFPVNVYKIQPGDLFMYKVGSNGEYTRHTYIIKNINVDGTFDVMYSTQDRFKKGLPLNRHKTYMFKKAPLNTGSDRNYWGFRRAKPAHLISEPQTIVDKEDFNQYSMARELGALQFFRQIKKINQSVEESPEMMLSRNLSTVCHSVQDRVGIVNSAISYQSKISGRCMNFREYDTHSTPSRDSGIRTDFTNYTLDYNEIHKSGKMTQVTAKTANLSYFILKSEKPSSVEQGEILRACPVNTGIFNVDLGSFQSNLKEGKVSFHPNDNIYYRWGIERGSRTRCETFYGYPE